MSDVETVRRIVAVERAVERLTTAEPAWTTTMVVIWAGALVDIPAGWQRCDGTGGTPDLTGSEFGGTYYIMKL
jgi:hypothetical protein